MNEAIASAFNDELEKISSLTAAIAGTLLGGAAGEHVSRKLLKGKYMAPITIATSLGGSIAAGNLYQGHRRKKRDRMLRELRRKERV